MFLRLLELVGLELKVLQSHLSVMKKMPKFWMRSKIALKSMLVNSLKKSISHHTVSINLMNLFTYEYSCNYFVISIYQRQVMNGVKQSCREYLHHSLLVIISSLRIDECFSFVSLAWHSLFSFIKQLKQCADHTKMPFYCWIKKITRGESFTLVVLTCTISVAIHILASCKIYQSFCFQFLILFIVVCIFTDGMK